RRHQPCPLAFQLLLPARKQLLPPLASASKSRLEGSIIPPDLLRPFSPLTRLVSVSSSSVACSFCANVWTGVQIFLPWFDRCRAATGCFRSWPLASSSAHW